jgi:hypothetical protein
MSMLGNIIYLLKNLLKGLGHEIIIRVRPGLGESPADIHFFFSAINFILN